MKRLVVVAVCCWMMSIIPLFSQESGLTCNLGFTFEINEDPVWGDKEPVIIDITPGSPAEKAGLKVNDIILSVNHNGTYLKSYKTVLSWFDENESEMVLAIRNLQHSFKEITVAKDCRPANCIREVQLAPVFAFYSLEDVQNRQFVIPITTKVNDKVQFHNYATFGFVPSDDASRELDERINAIFIRVLGEMGLQYRPKDPDFIIQTYYSYQNNPMFKTDSPTYGSYQPVWRFDTRNRRMVKQPLYDPSEPVRVDDVAFNLEFGFRFFDRKFVEPGEMTLMWEGEVKERLTRHYPLSDYLEMNLPLMLLKFPNPGNRSSATLVLRYLKYHYTGLAFDIKDLKTVVSVDPGSPADLAGILPGDVITNVEGHDFNHTSQSLTEGYRRFLSETMNFRDKNTRYTDTNGFKQCMYWNILHYNDVSKAIANNNRYKTAFSYLFNFNQYIDWNRPSAINFVVDRNGEVLNLFVTPIIATSYHLRAK